jgi:peptide/nickel transport system permease protein
VYQDTWADYAGRLISITALSVPSFVIGTLIILFPALWWDYSPPLAFVPFWEDPLTNLQIMLPAALALGAILSGTSMRMTRSMVLEVLRSDYVRTAHGKGLGGVLVMRRHVLRNALIPVVTLWGTSFAQLLGGSVVIELIFALPGIGRLTLQSIEVRDYTQLQGNVLFFALVFVLFNLMVDLLYGLFDPRIRYA